MDIDLGQIVRDGISDGFLMAAQALGNVALNNMNYIMYVLTAVVGLKIGDKLAECVLE